VVVVDFFFVTLDLDFKAFVHVLVFYLDDQTLFEQLYIGRIISILSVVRFNDVDLEKL